MIEKPSPHEGPQPLNEVLFVFDRRLQTAAEQREIIAATMDDIQAQNPQQDLPLDTIEQNPGEDTNLEFRSVSFTKPLEFRSDQLSSGTLYSIHAPSLASTFFQFSRALDEIFSDDKDKS